MYFYLYQDKQGQWRRNLRSANHQIICDSAEGCTQKQGAMHGIALVKAGAASAKTYDESTKIWL